METKKIGVAEIYKVFRDLGYVSYLLGNDTLYVASEDETNALLAANNWTPRSQP